MIKTYYKTLGNSVIYSVMSPKNFKWHDTTLLGGRAMWAGLSNCGRYISSDFLAVDFR